MNQIADNTNLAQFWDSLAGGVQRQILEAVLTKTAKAVITHGAKGRKGKITIQLDLSRLNDEEDNAGLKVESKISYQLPTKRGDVAENEKRESVMYLTPKGLSDVPARIADEEETDHPVRNLNELPMRQREAELLPR